MGILWTRPSEVNTLGQAEQPEGGAQWELGCGDEGGPPCVSQGVDCEPWAGVASCISLQTALGLPVQQAVQTEGGSANNTSVLNTFSLIAACSVHRE